MWWNRFSSYAGNDPISRVLPLIALLSGITDTSVLHLMDSGGNFLICNEFSNKFNVKSDKKYSAVI